MCVDCVDDYFGENEAFLTKRLHESLPIKRTIHIRNGVAYLTVRAWRQREKAQQIAAFKRLKRCPSSDLVGYATDDLAATLTALFGAGRDLTFTHVPCGHSGHAQCLSRRLAEEVAAACGGRYMPLWHDRPQTGSSHPRTIVARPPLRWKSWPAGRTIVIDDVATASGALTVLPGGFGPLWDRVARGMIETDRGPVLLLDLPALIAGPAAPRAAA